jgi:hypothetical protein
MTESSRKLKEDRKKVVKKEETKSSLKGSKKSMPVDN